MEQKQVINIMTAAIDQALANMHTCTIAKVTEVKAKTISCKPVLNRLVNGESIELPVFADVPPIFLQGGSSYHAFPIAVDDYCLLFFTERCFDGWYNGQDFVAPLEYRMHDYSDGFALVGLNNLAGAKTIPSVIQQTGNTNQDGDYTHQGDREQTGDYGLTGLFTLIGNMLQTGDMTITGDLQSSNIVSDGALSGQSMNMAGLAGVSGTFQQDGGGTITVTNGIITGIS